jgi:hypothetical protein
MADNNIDQVLSRGEKVLKNFVELTNKMLEAGMQTFQEMSATVELGYADKKQQRHNCWNGTLHSSWWFCQILIEQCIHLVLAS